MQYKSSHEYNMARFDCDGRGRVLHVARAGPNVGPCLAGPALVNV